MQLTFHGDLAGLAEPAAWAAWLGEQYIPEWVVYAKRPFAGPEVVLKYLARYTHRVALSNRRLVCLADGVVEFTAKDYAVGGRARLVRLSADEFLRRWVQHVLPAGFVKIRHYGLLANRGREERLALCRMLLALWGLVQCVLGELSTTPVGGRSCPSCGGECWQRVAEIARPQCGPALDAAGQEWPDTS